MDYTQFALFSDLDGTLFGPNRQVSPENLAALAQFRAGGGLFGVSTGRSPVNLRDMLPPGITNTWSVVLNRAMAYDFATGQAALTQALAHMDSFVRWVLAAYPAVNVLFHPLHYPKIVRSPPRFFYFPLFPCSLPLPKFAFLLPLNLPYYIPLLPSITSDCCRLDDYVSLHYLLKHMAHLVQAVVWTAGLDDRLADSGLIPF